MVLTPMDIVTRRAARAAKASNDRPPISSFHAWKLNSTTFVVQERDSFGEIPLIYVKIHPKAPVIIITDTGSDEPRKEYQKSRYIHLRDYLEKCPVACNDDKPFNADGARTYVIICTHCHYDHTLGVPQFLRGGTTQIIASAAGRDFIESDLKHHGEFDTVDRIVPLYWVTHWAQAFERLTWPPSESSPAFPASDSDSSAAKAEVVDLGITFIQTPGHTPDSLAWYDHDERHLFVGDSLYEPGKENMPIIWPAYGDLVEWMFSMAKLHLFARSENVRLEQGAAAATGDVEGDDNDDDDDDDDDEWVEVAGRVKLAAGHQTFAGDAESLLFDVQELFWNVARGSVPVFVRYEYHGEEYTAWKTKDAEAMWFRMPTRLMDAAKRFFAGSGELLR